MTTLQSLPVELLLQVHLLALSPNLPSVSKHIHSSISNNTSPLYRATWIHAKLSFEGINLAPSTSRHNKKGSKVPQYLSHALRFPICDITVLKLLEEKCLDTLNKQSEISHCKLMKVVQEAFLAHPTKLPPTPEFPDGRFMSSKELFQNVHSGRSVTLSCGLSRASVDIPKRLFRRLLSCPAPSSSSFPHATHTTHTDAFDKQDLPLLLHVLDNLRGNPDSHKGYALAKAVLARHFDLIRLLLRRGADPAVKDSMSVMLAIGRNDIEIVRMLIEGGAYVQYANSAKTHGDLGAWDYTPGEGGEDSENGSGTSRKKRKRRLGGQEEQNGLGISVSAAGESGSSSSPGKRRRVEDRVPVTSAMLELAVRQKCEPLIQYFMAKGAVPNLKTLGMLQA